MIDYKIEYNRPEWNAQDIGISVLMGKTLNAINEDDDSIVFKCTDGSIYVMYHKQDCCESVHVESIVGDLCDLLGTPILKAEESTSEDTPSDVGEIDYDGSNRWTFYKLATIKGYVDIRWFGSSNGYYGVSVDFVCVQEGAL